MLHTLTQIIRAASRPRRKSGNVWPAEAPIIGHYRAALHRWQKLLDKPGFRTLDGYELHWFEECCGDHQRMAEEVMVISGVMMHYEPSDGFTPTGKAEALRVCRALLASHANTHVKRLVEDVAALCGLADKIRAAA